MTRRKKVIGITRGTFQILHAGHVRFLSQASALVDELHVFIDGDKRVKELKGECLVTADDRAAVLFGLESVTGLVHTFICEEDFQEQITNFDHVFGEHNYWSEKAPTYIYFKGGDYNPTELPERSFMEDLGYIICTLSHSGHSTSDLVKRIRNGQK